MFNEKTEGNLSTYLEMKQYQEKRYETFNKTLYEKFIESLSEDRIIKKDRTSTGMYVIFYWGESESNDG